ncbi:MAG: hypothetical protein ABGY42_16615, partial [bacterium]
ALEPGGVASGGAAASGAASGTVEASGVGGPASVDPTSPDAVLTFVRALAEGTHAARKGATA